MPEGQGFPPQHQPRQPGRESEMQPRPEAEARRWRGSGKLTGKAALITGGDSGIGRSVALQLAKGTCQNNRAELEAPPKARHPRESGDDGGKGKRFSYFGTHPKRRIRVNAVAPAFVFLALSDATYMTGQVLHPNGSEIVGG